MSFGTAAISQLCCGVLPGIKWAPTGLTRTVRLSLLDRSRTRTGYPEAAALQHSVQRAVAAEQLGYHRFWAAEHHAVPGVASGAPAVLLAAAGAATSRIRLGSGGVMLPHHQPLVVAEQFLMLAGLYPQRVDLGLGRTLGFTEPVRRALRQDSDDPQAYENDVAETLAYLAGTAAVTARPSGGDPPEVFLLATGQGIKSAARLGLPVVIGGPVLQEPELPQMLTQYRRQFRPSSAADEPAVIISAEVYVAETDDDARDLALPEAWAMARSRETGVFGPLEPVEEIRQQRWSPKSAQRVEKTLDRGFIGTRSKVRAQLASLVEATGAGELMVATSTYDREALAELDAETADLILGEGL